MREARVLIEFPTSQPLYHLGKRSSRDSKAAHSKNAGVPEVHASGIYQEPGARLSLSKPWFCFLVCPIWVQMGRDHLVATSQAVVRMKCYD
jgi:hypothetical protein